MKEILSHTDVRIPKHCLFNKKLYAENKTAYLDELLNHVGLPAFVKPIDQVSSINTLRIAQPEDLYQWASCVAEDEFTYEIDEFITGDIYHIDSLIKDNNVLFCAAGKLNTPADNFAKGKAMGSITLQKDSPLFAKFEQYNDKVLHTLKAPDGSTHMEVFVTADEEIIFLEIAARTPGGLIMRSYNHIYDVDFAKYYYYLQTNFPFNFTSKKATDYIAWLFFSKPEGVIKKLNEPCKIQSKYTIQWYCEAGEYSEQSKDITIKHLGGLIILENDDYQQLYSEFIELTDFPFIVVN